ncbi:trigger factor [Altererythrobacter sp. TH136]|uniref:trigger factor n=1 Tax=Altererythrobacter sp. TH136 TaxID=2067415 RepID=UPI00116277FA|nr:trigger factor [Altererythrobacter sp. TH136]QDM41538.1 trigger factor [Altererythrobacter sp. TH136]
MKIEETTNEGLRRTYAVTIPAQDIDAAIEAEVKKIAPQVRMPGFRPGKVPANLVKKMHGEAIHGQVVNEQIQGAVDGLMRDKQLRPAMQPQVQFGDGYEQGKDATLTVDVEVLPEIEAPSLDGLKLERLTVPVADSEVDEAVNNIASQQKTFKDSPKNRKAADGDQLIIDFTGSIDGVEFEGGKAEETPLVIGANRFIPGFEEQLAGAKAGDDKTITVTFPADYPAKELAGKDAQFAIHVHKVQVEDETAVDEEFAKSLGLESLEQLRGLLKGQLEQELNGLTRTAMKRQLLDTLASGHDFPVPQGMVDAEFEQIWQQLQQEAAGEEDPEAALKEIEAEKADYRAIAERRVRLGLLLSEIGQANGVQVTQQEMSMLIQQAAQQYRPEDRDRFMELIRTNDMAAAQLRAPLYEDKVVDFLFDKADITDREVTREELQAAIEAEETSAPAAAASPAGKKKAPAKKAAKAQPAADAPAEDAPVAGEASSEDATPAKPAKKAAAKKNAEATEDKSAAKKAPAKKAAAKK